MADIELIKGADNGNPSDKLSQAYPKINRSLTNVNNQVVNHEGRLGTAESTVSNHGIRITAAENEIIAHEDSTVAHAAEHVTYDGAVLGASNVKQAVDLQKSVVDSLVISGDSSPAAAQAKVDTFGVDQPTLKDRLDNDYLRTAAQLADTADHLASLVINVKYPPPPLVGAKGGGVDDTVAIQNIINYAQSLNPGAVLYSNGSNSTLLGIRIYFPMDRYKITSDLVINATNKTQEGDATNTIAGIELAGDGITSTIIDSTDATSGDSVTILGGFTKVSDMQILNSKGSGIVSNQWGNVFERVFINNPAIDGIYVASGFKIMISKCFVFDAGAYGISFNDYHTTCLVENNYVLSPTLGGYFVGNRDNISLTKGMTYSTFASNACDGGVIAYTFAGCRAVEVNGCGCEVISNRALYISGTESSVSINGFLADRVTGNGVYIEGNRAKVTINGYVDSNPINVGVPLIAGGGTDAKAVIVNITNKRTYLYDSAVTLDISSSNNKKHKVVNFDVKNKVVADFKHPSGYSANYGGLIAIRCFHGGSSAPNGSINTATYYLLLNKGSGGSNIATVSFAGLKGDETALQSWPSFDFTFSGDSLTATHTNTGTWTSRDFSFSIETTGDIVTV